MAQSSTIDLVACRKWIAAALEYGHGTHTIDDIFDGIERGHLHLWPAERGCIVTEFVTFPQRKMLKISYAGGDMDEVLDLAAKVEPFAKANGCDAVIVGGRFGWQRVLKRRGYEAVAVTLFKEI